MGLSNSVGDHHAGGMDHSPLAYASRGRPLAAVEYPLIYSEPLRLGRPPPYVDRRRVWLYDRDGGVFQGLYCPIRGYPSVRPVNYQ